MNLKGAPVIVEVCVGSLVDISAALLGGADRVELCSALELGGLTPSVGLVELAVAEGKLPVVAMLRPRAGGFCYDRSEFAAMERDAQRLLRLGVAGFAFGVLDRDGGIDLARCRALVDAVAPLPATFHRAFDFVADQRRQLEALIDVGCRRVLTSGAAATAEVGIDVLGALAHQAAGRIEVMPGGGITAENVRRIAAGTGCRQLHLGAATPGDDGSIRDGAPWSLCDARYLQGRSHRAVSGAAVAAAIAALRDGDP